MNNLVALFSLLISSIAGMEQPDFNSWNGVAVDDVPLSPDPFSWGGDISGSQYVTDPYALSPPPPPHPPAHQPSGRTILERYESSATSKRNERFPSFLALLQNTCNPQYWSDEQMLAYLSLQEKINDFTAQTASDKLDEKAIAYQAGLLSQMVEKDCKIFPDNQELQHFKRRLDEIHSVYSNLAGKQDSDDDSDDSWVVPSARRNAQLVSSMGNAGDQSSGNGDAEAEDEGDISDHELAKRMRNIDLSGRVGTRSRLVQWRRARQRKSTDSSQSGPSSPRSSEGGETSELEQLFYQECDPAAMTPDELLSFTELMDTVREVENVIKSHEMDDDRFTAEKLEVLIHAVAAEIEKFPRNRKLQVVLDRLLDFKNVLEQILNARQFDNSPGPSGVDTLQKAHQNLLPLIPLDENSELHSLIEKIRLTHANIQRSVRNLEQLMAARDKLSRLVFELRNYNILSIQTFVASYTRVVNDLSWQVNLNLRRKGQFDCHGYLAKGEPHRRWMDLVRSLQYFISRVPKQTKEFLIITGKSLDGNGNVRRWSMRKQIEDLLAGRRDIIYTKSNGAIELRRTSADDDRGVIAFMNLIESRINDLQ